MKLYKNYKKALMINHHQMRVFKINEIQCKTNTIEDEFINLVSHNKSIYSNSPNLWLKASINQKR